MKDVTEVKKRLQAEKRLLVKDYGVKDIGLFGSFIKGNVTASSDIDILVDFSKTIDLFTFVDLKNHLSDLLNTDVDLVMKKGLKPGIGKRILAEVEYI